MIKVLIADDSITSREILVQLFKGDPIFEIAGFASNGEEAVRKTIELKPDIITMDIKMPVMNGIEATRIIMKESPTPIVIISAHLDIDDAESGIKAMQFGALALRKKLPSIDDSIFDYQCEKLINTVKAMADVRVVTRKNTLIRSKSTTSTNPSLALDKEKPKLVAIAASTGGPQALVKLFKVLGTDFNVPILLTQHIGQGFADGYVQWMRSLLCVNAKLAQHGETLEPSIVYVAPDDQHLGISSSFRVKLSSDPHISGFRPSANFMFESVGKTIGKNSLAIILSGMGNDGVDGLEVLKDNGGCIIAQNKDSCVVFGMPGKAVERGICSYQLSPEAIGELLLGVIV